MRTGDLFDAQLQDGSFDAVVMGDVLEHFPDPGAALDRIASLTAPGSVLHLALPDAGSRVARTMGARWWSVIPTHVQYFTRSSLQTLLARHGWELLELGSAPKAFTVRYYRDLLQRSPDCAGLALQILRLYWETSVDGPKPHSLTW